MPPVYTVRAAVIAVRSDRPRATDRFFVDSNVWAWDFYFGSFTPSGVRILQQPEYAAYLRLTRAAGATRCHAGLSLAELASLIEANELEANLIGVGPRTVKEYRHNVPSERSRVVREIQRAWARVEADSELLPLFIDAPTIASARSRLSSELLDGYDLFLREAMAAASVTQILSDDGDFSSAPGVELFTANPRVLAAATSQGRLLTH
jgi:hypothetical protein